MSGVDPVLEQALRNAQAGSPRTSNDAYSLLLGEPVEPIIEQAPSGEDPVLEQALWNESIGSDWRRQESERQRFLLQQEQQDPNGEQIARTRLALFFAEKQRVDPAFAYQNLDGMIANYAGEPLPATTLWQELKDVWKTGWLQNQINELYYLKATGQGVEKRIEDPNAVLDIAYLSPRTDLDIRIRALREQLPLPSTTRRGIVANALKWAAGSLPLMLYTALEGAKWGMVTASAAAVANTLMVAPAAGTLALTGVGALPSASLTALTALSSYTAAFGYGTAVGSGVKLDQLMIGMTYEALEEFRDEQGRPLEPGIIRKIAIPVGTLIGMLEGLQIRTVLGAWSPALSKAFGETVTDVLRGTILKSLGSNLTKKAAAAGIDILTEGIEEGSQQLVQMLGENIAMTWQERQRGGQFDKHTVEEIAKAVLENTGVGIAASVPLMMPGMILGPLVRQTLGIMTEEEYAEYKRKLALKELMEFELERKLELHPELAQSLNPSAVRPKTTPTRITAEITPVSAGAPAAPPALSKTTTIAVEPAPKRTFAAIVRDIQKETKAWQVLPAEWAEIEQTRQAFNDSPSVGISPYKEVFTKAYSPLRNAIMEAAPHFAMEEIDGVAVLLEVLADAQGIDLKAFTDTVFAKDMFAKPEELPGLIERMQQTEAAELGLAGAATPEEQEKLAYSNMKVAARVAVSRGVTEFLNDGKALIHLLKSANFGTAVHEIGHVLRRWLPDSMMEEAAKWAGAVGGRWTMRAEERFANALVDYIRTGVAPVPKLRDVFQRFAEWLEFIYKSLRDRIEITPEIKHTFDEIFSNRGSLVVGERLKIEPNPKPADALPIVFEVDETRAVQNDPAAVAEEDFIRQSDYQMEIRRTYIDAEGNRRTIRGEDGREMLVSSRTMPVGDLHLALGQWMIDDQFRGIHGHEIAQLRKITPDLLHTAWDGQVHEAGQYVLTEDAVPHNIEGRGFDSERYAGWLKAGFSPPPICAVETDKGTFNITDGHRRAFASLSTGLPIYAWVWPAMPHPDGLLDSSTGKVMAVGMTYEGVKGKEWVEPVRQRYLFEIVPSEQKKLNAAAEKYFGTTDDPSEAGYILSNGKMLDFSGRHRIKEYAAYMAGKAVEGAMTPEDFAGQRSVDHREIPVEVMEGEVSGTARMIQWMNKSGAVRIDYSAGVFETQTDLTEKQYKTIEGFLRGMKTVLLQRSNSRGEQIGFKEIFRPTIDHLRLFFDDKEFMRAERYLHEVDPRAQSEFNKQCVDFFGTTDNPAKSAWILSTGQMLDFDNRWGLSETVMVGGKAVHRMIGAVPTVGIVDSIRRAMSYGASRMDWARTYTVLQTCEIPTEEQFAAIERILRGVEKLELEYSDPRTGDMRAFKEFDWPTIQQVRDFFDANKYYAPKYLFDTDPWLLRSAETVRMKIRARMPGKQVKGTLVANGVTLDEMHWFGLDEWLKDDQLYEPNELLAFIARNAVRVEETVLGTAEPTRNLQLVWQDEEVESNCYLPGGIRLLINLNPVDKKWYAGGGEVAFDTREAAKTFYEQARVENSLLPAPHAEYDVRNYMSEGGKNYREILFRLGWKPISETEQQVKPGYEEKVAEINRQIEELFRKQLETRAIADWTEQERAGNIITDEMDLLVHQRDTMCEAKQRIWNEPWQTRHFDSYKNILAWIRTQDYIDNEGAKVFLVDEFQSEYAEEAKHKGLGEPAKPELVYRQAMEAVLPDRELLVTLANERRRIEAAVQDVQNEYEKATEESQLAEITERLTHLVEYKKALLEASEKTSERIGLALKEEKYTGKSRPVPFIASRRWGIMAWDSSKNAYQEYKTPAGQMQRFATPEEAEKFFKKLPVVQGEKPSYVADLGYIENTACWAGMEFRRALRWAVEHGYDKLAWTDGATQNKRWSLTHFLTSIEWTKVGDGIYDFDAYNSRGENVFHGWDLTGEGLRQHLGKQVADRILAGQADLTTAERHELEQGRATRIYENVPGNWVYATEDGTSHGDWFSKEAAQGAADQHNQNIDQWRMDPAKRSEGRLRGLSLEVGGDFMKLLYDKIVVNYAAKYTKQWGAEVKEGYLPLAIPDRLKIRTTLQGNFVIHDAVHGRDLHNRDLGMPGEPEQPHIFTGRAEAERCMAIENVKRHRCGRYQVCGLGPSGGEWIVDAYPTLEEAEAAIPATFDPTKVVDYYVKDSTRQRDITVHMVTTAFGPRYVIANSEGYLTPEGETTDRFRFAEQFNSRREGWATANRRYGGKPQRIWYVDITPAMRESAKEGRFQQFLMEPDAHEQKVESAVARGEPVPDEVLESYADREWAKSEIGFREAEVERIRTGNFTDASEYITFQDTMRDPEEPAKSYEYWMMLWGKAGGDVETGGGDFKVLTPTEANRKFIKSVSTEERMAGFLMSLEQLSHSDQLKKGTGMRTVFSSLPKGIYLAYLNAKKQALAGSMSKESFITALKLMKAEPERYREMVAALGDEEQQRQLDAEREMAPAEETRLRNENSRLRAELKAFRAVEKDALRKAAAGKELYAMTKAEWAARAEGMNVTQRERYLASQESRIREAIQAGRTIPPEVLEEWPKLAQLYAQKQGAQPTAAAVETVAPAAPAQQPLSAEELGQALATAGVAGVETAELTPQYVDLQLEIAKAINEAKQEWERQRTELQQKLVDYEETAKAEAGMTREIQKLKDYIAYLDRRIAVAKTRERMAQKLIESEQRRRADREAWKQGMKQRQEHERVKAMIRAIHRIEWSVPKMHSEVQQPLRSTFEAVNAILAGHDATVELTDLRNLLAEEGLEFPFEYLSALDDMNRRSFGSFTPEQIEILLHAITHWIQVNHELEVIRIGDEMIRHDNAVAQALGEMKPADESVRAVERLDPTRWEKIRAKTGDTAQALIGIGQVQYMLLTEMLGGPKSIMHQLFGTQIEDGRKVQLQKKFEYLDLFTRRVADLKLPELFNWLRETETYQNGDTQIELTRSKKLCLYMHSLSEDNRESILLRGMGSRTERRWRNRPMKIHENLFEDVTARMDDQEFSFTSLLQEMMQMTGDEMSPIYEQMYGYPMPRPANYWHKDVMPTGTARARTFEQKEEIAKGRRRLGNVAVPNSRVKTRLDVRVPLYLNNVEFDLMETIKYTAQYIGLKIPVYQAAKLLRDADFTAAMGSRYSPSFLREIEQGLRDVVGEDQALSTIERVLTQTRYMMQVAFLGNNPFSMLKILLGFANGLAHIRMDYLVRGIADTMLHYKAVDTFHRTFSVLFRDRVEEGFTRDIAEEAKLREAGKLVGAKYYVKRAGMAGIRWADRSAINFVMRGAFLQAMEELQKGELSEETKRGIGEALGQRKPKQLTVEQRFDLAMRFADYVQTRTQDQHLPEYRSPLSRASAAAGMAKFFTMFGSNTNTNLNVLIRAVNDFRFGKGTNGRRAAKLMKVSFLVLFAVPMAEAMVNHLRDTLLKRYGDDEDKWATVLSNYLDNVASLSYFIRDIADGVLSKAREGKSREFTIPPVQLINDTISTLSTIVDVITHRGEAGQEQMMNRLWNKIADLLIMLSQLPLYMPKRYLQELIEKQKGGR